MNEQQQITVIHDFEKDLYPVNGKNLTNQELDKLVALMPSVQWTIITFKDYSKQVTTIEDFKGIRWNETKQYHREG